MTEVKRYHVGDTGLVEGVALGRITVVLGADFDRIEAERDALQLLLNERDEQLDESTAAARDVFSERHRQVAAEGWTVVHDNSHQNGQLARAAACYAVSGSSDQSDQTAALLVSLAWPWDENWWKPTSKRRDLVKAGALILAEIERLDRAALNPSPEAESHG